MTNEENANYAFDGFHDVAVEFVKHLALIEFQRMIEEEDEIVEMIFREMGISKLDPTNVIAENVIAKTRRAIILFFDHLKLDGGPDETRDED